VELSTHPVSQAFFSAAALRLKEEGSKTGFSKITALINELIHDNRKQLQSIRKVNAKVKAECAVVTHKLKDRAVFFQGQSRYFKRRGSVTLSQETEARNIKASREAQLKSYGDLLTAATARYTRKIRKWNSRCSNSKKAIDKANIAIRAVKEWKPRAGSAFVQKSIKEVTDLYKVIKKMPLAVPEEMIQLAASDAKLKKRLYQWLNYLLAALTDNLAKCQTAKNGVTRVFTSLKTTVGKLRTALSKDSKALAKALENYKILIKVYVDNEKIYTNLFNQNSLLITSNSKYCLTESRNFASGQKAMEDQLKTFIGLRFWLRKNFHRVKRWIKRKYSKAQ